MAFRKRKQAAAPPPQAEDARSRVIDLASAYCFACSQHPDACTCVNADAWMALPYDPDFWRLCEACHKPFAVPKRDSTFVRCVVCAPGDEDAEVQHGKVPPAARTGSFDFRLADAAANATA